jgi:molecular chaperone GrpE
MVRNLHPAAELAAYKIGQTKNADLAGVDDKHLRLAAEFDNYKKRTSRQYAELIKNANEDLILEFLTVMDDFERAIQTIGDDNGGKLAESAESVLSGMKLIYEKLTNVLKGRGVKQFDPIDQVFDPHYHDAVIQMPSDKGEGIVIGVISPGYIMNDKVIRHAKVIVASSK